MSVCQVNEKLVQGCECAFQTVFPVSAHESRKLGQFVRLINHLSAKSIICFFLLVVLLVCVTVCFNSWFSLLACL